MNTVNQDLLDQVLARLDRSVTPDSQWPDARGEYWALCPFHDDRHARNFSINGQTGLWKCQACDAKGGLKKLADHLGIEVDPPPGPDGLTLEAYADAKRLPIGFLRSLDVSQTMDRWDRQSPRVPTVRILYRGLDGRIVTYRRRFNLQKASGGPDRRFKWRYRTKARGLLYGLWRLEEMAKAGWILLLEGESDCHTAWLHDIPALGVPGAANWDAASAGVLKGVQVFVWAEPDRGGSTFVNAIAKSLPAAAVIRSDRFKDLSDAHIAGENVAALIDSLKATAVPIAEVATGEPQESDGLPKVDAGEQDLAIVSAEAWEALQRVNGPAPFLFRYGGAPTRLEQDGATAILRELTVDRLRHECARAARWYKVRIQVDGTMVEAAAKPPLDVMRDMLAGRDLALPPLSRIVDAPVFAPDGRLQTEPGYHESSRTFYAPAAGISVPEVASSPSAEDVAEAKRLLLEELFGEFPFVTDADRAHLVALALLPFARDLIAGCTPNHLIEASAPGSGKGLAARAALIPGIGENVALVAEARDDDEWRKRLTAALREGRPAILIDNVVGSLDSGILAAALTAPIWTDRILGASEMVSLPVRCAWVTTANNCTLSTEIARRSIRIRLDAKVDRPWLRDGFRHADLCGWALENRCRLIWAALTIVQAWIAAGRPRADVRPLGSYERWTAVMGGILQHADIPGFLANLDVFYEQADVEGALWRQFVALWWERFGDREVGTSELFPLALDFDGFELNGKSERAQRVQFGKMLVKQRDRVVGEWRVAKAGTAQRAARWRLLPIASDATLVNIVNVSECSVPGGSFEVWQKSGHMLNVEGGGDIHEHSPHSLSGDDPAPSNGNGNGHGVSIPLVITRKMRLDLEYAGYAPSDIDRMTPEEAWRLLGGAT